MNDFTFFEGWRQHTRRTVVCEWLYLFLRLETAHPSLVTLFQRREERWNCRLPSQFQPWRVGVACLSYVSTFKIWLFVPPSKKDITHCTYIILSVLWLLVIPSTIYPWIKLVFFSVIREILSRLHDALHVMSLNQIYL